jgi:hypothetical protein
LGVRGLLEFLNKLKMIATEIRYFYLFKSDARSLYLNKVCILIAFAVMHELEKTAPYLIWGHPEGLEMTGFQLSQE